MSASRLAIVASTSPAPVPSGAIGQRIRDLRLEARKLAREQVELLHQSLVETARLAAEIAEGGDAYPAGVRDLARRFVEDCEAKVQTLEAITARA